MMELIYLKMKKTKGAERRKGRQRTKHLQLERKWDRQQEKSMEDGIKEKKIN
jgi:hypothetical protein